MPSGGQGWCSACRNWYASLWPSGRQTAGHHGFRRENPAHENRLREYEARAAAEIPLFDPPVV